MGGVDRVGGSPVSWEQGLFRPRSFFEAGGVLLYKEMLKQVFKNWSDGYPMTEPFHIQVYTCAYPEGKLCKCPILVFTTPISINSRMNKEFGYIHKTGYDKTTTMSKLLLHATWMNLK